MPGVPGFGCDGAGVGQKSSLQILHTFLGSRDSSIVPLMKSEVLICINKNTVRLYIYIYRVCMLEH